MYFFKFIPLRILVSSWLISDPSLFLFSLYFLNSPLITSDSSLFSMYFLKFTYLGILNSSLITLDSSLFLFSMEFNFFSCGSFSIAVNINKFSIYRERVLPFGICELGFLSYSSLAFLYHRNFPQ